MWNAFLNYRLEFLAQHTEEWCHSCLMDIEPTLLLVLIGWGTKSEGTRESRNDE